LLRAQYLSAVLRNATGHDRALAAAHKAPSAQIPIHKQNILVTPVNPQQAASSAFRQRGSYRHSLNCASNGASKAWAWETTDVRSSCSEARCEKATDDDAGCGNQAGVRFVGSSGCGFDGGAAVQVQRVYRYILYQASAFNSFGSARAPILLLRPQVRGDARDAQCDELRARLVHRAGRELVPAVRRHCALRRQNNPSRTRTAARQPVSRARDPLV
jgi:hypothetical protein